MKSRTFGLADAMLLVVAAATGLWLNRMDWGEMHVFHRNAYDSVEQILSLILPHVAAGTMALVGMRMRRPRPPLRRLARQPGAVACMAASAIFLVLVGWAATTRATGRFLSSRFAEKGYGRRPSQTRSVGWFD